VIPRTRGGTPLPPGAALALPLLAYAAASLLHHVHNAEFLADFPNMPGWLSRMAVYAAWLGVTAVGLLGYLLVVRGSRLMGLSVIAVYAALGFYGLAHYGLAPFTAHSAAMHATILLEVAAAGWLLGAVTRSMLGRAQVVPRERP
jgi:hypothetical protein